MKKTLALVIGLAVAFSMLIGTPAQATSHPPVKGEPKCSGMWIWTNCEARDLYRFVAAKTKSNDVTSVKASLLMVGTAMGQSAKRDDDIAANVEWAILSVDPVIQRGTAKCARTAVLNLIKNNTKSARAIKTTEKAYSVAVGLVKAKGITGKAYKAYLKKNKSLFDQVLPIATSINKNTFHTQISRCNFS